MRAVCPRGMRKKGRDRMRGLGAICVARAGRRRASAIWSAVIESRCAAQGVRFVRGSIEAWTEYWDEKSGQKNERSEARGYKDGGYGFWAIWAGNVLGAGAGGSLPGDQAEGARLGWVRVRRRFARRVSSFGWARGGERCVGARELGELTKGGIVRLVVGRGCDDNGGFLGGESCRDSNCA